MTAPWAERYSRVITLTAAFVIKLIEACPTTQAICTLTRLSWSTVNAIMVSAVERGRLAMKNTGDTIPAEYLDRVFDRFLRVDPSRQRSSEGTGLGLAITKSTVVAYGGTISAASLDQVTTFTISLPRAS